MKKYFNLYGLFFKFFNRQKALLNGYLFLYGLKSLFPTFYLMGVAFFIENVTSFWQRGKESFLLFLPALILLFGLVLFQNISELLLSFQKEKITRYLTENVEPEWLEKSLSYPFEVLESQDYRNTAELVFNQPSQQLTTTLENSLEICSIVASFIFLLIPLSLKVPWIPFVLLSLTIPLILAALANGKNNYGVFASLTPLRRRNRYLLDLATEEAALEERKVFKNTSPLTEKYSQDWLTLYKKEKRLARPFFLKLNLFSFFANFVGIGTGLILLLPLSQGKITAALFIATLNSVLGIMRNVSSRLLPILEEYGENFQYLQEVQHFLAYPTTETENTKQPLSEIKKISFQQVSFKYPGTSQYVLKDLTFTLEKGKQYAFFGENGSGKTTLLKIILGLYSPTSGKITYKKIPNTPTFGEISGLTQNFQRYKLTIEENLGISEDINLVDPLQAKKVLDDTELAPIFSAKDLTLESLLSKEFGGIDLSGGLWQRLAIARSFYKKKANFLFWDEPTAAIDPLEEQRVFSYFKNYHIEKTSLMVTHKLAAARHADWIYVMEKGRLVESGTHDTLLLKNGLYAKMWQVQAGMLK